MQVFRTSFRPTSLLAATMLATSTLAASLMLLPQARAAAPAAETAKGEVLTPEVGHFLQETQKALQTHNLNQAMASVDAAQGVKGKTAYDSYVIAQMAAAVAVQAGQHAVAIRAYDALIQNPRTSPAQKAQYLEAEVGLSYDAKDYGEAVKSATRYLKEVGPSAKMETLLVQCPYLQKDWKGVVQAATSIVANAEKAGQRPPENILQMLADAQGQLNDKAAQNNAYALLARYYPSTQYWQILFHNLATTKNLSPRLVFNLARLRLAAGVPADPAAYQDMAERAVQMGLPQLALNLLNYGQAQHVLGPTSKADPASLAKQAQFYNFIAKQAAQVKETLWPQVRTAEREAHAGPSLTAGYNLVLNGQAHLGLMLMRTGLARHPKDPAEALLEYGMALIDCGHVHDALRVFAIIPANSPAHDLAVLWTALLQAPHPAPSATNNQKTPHTGPH